MYWVAEFGPDNDLQLDRVIAKMIQTSLYVQSSIISMESNLNALSNPKLISADPQDPQDVSSSSDSIPSNDEYSWEHPHKQWVVWLFEEM